MALVLPRAVKRSVLLQIALKAFKINVLKAFTSINVRFCTRVRSASRQLLVASCWWSVWDSVLATLETCKRSGGILGGETAKQHFPSAELRDGPRDSVLALKPSWHHLIRFVEARASIHGLEEHRAVVRSCASRR